jgi:two-component system cell cycle sensor histidine kinase/response regulator CckA
MLYEEQGTTLQSKVPTILVIDDTEVVRKSVARCLRRRGYVVLEASNADEALALVSSNGENLDLILADVVLPTMGGIEVIAEARRRFPRVAAAYMTGHFGKSARCELSPEEGTLVLIKPFTPNLLESSVREALVQAGVTMPSMAPLGGGSSRFGA